MEQTTNREKVDFSKFIRSPAQTAEESKTTPTAPTTSAQESIFECMICLETVKEPVVTLCGHLYCWPCIYQWLEQPRDQKLCPMCKSAISQDKLVPIFTKGNTEDPRKNTPNIPNRPAGQREEPQRRQGLFGNQPPNFQFAMGLGILPSLVMGLTELFGGINDMRAQRPMQRQPGNQADPFMDNIMRLVFLFIVFLVMSLVGFGNGVFIIL